MGYERKPFTTSAGQEVSLYSIVQKDYDQNGVIDGDDIAWIGDHGSLHFVQNMPEFDGIKPKRDYQGLQSVIRRVLGQLAGVGVVPVLELFRVRLASFLYPRALPGSAAARCARTSTSRVRCSGTTELDEQPQSDDQQPRWSTALHAEVQSSSCLARITFPKLRSISAAGCERRLDDRCGKSRLPTAHAVR